MTRERAATGTSTDEALGQILREQRAEPNAFQPAGPVRRIGLDKGRDPHKGTSPCPVLAGHGFSDRLGRHPKVSYGLLVGYRGEIS